MPETTYASQFKHCPRCGSSLWASLQACAHCGATTDWAPPKRESGAAGDPSLSPRYGTFWQRAGAAALDNVVVALLEFGFYAIGPGRLALWLLLFSAPLVWIYEVGTTARWGQTLGKMFVGVRVVRTDFTPIGFRRALLRSAVMILLGCAYLVREARLVGHIPQEIVEAIPARYIATFFEQFDPDHSSLVLMAWPTALWGLAELVTMIFHPERRAVHDLIAGTVVIRTTDAARPRWLRPGLRIALALLVWVGLMPSSYLAMRRPYQSHFPDGTLRGEFVPPSKGAGAMMEVHRSDGSLQHRLVTRTRSAPAAWESFDENGAVTHEAR